MESSNSSLTWLSAYFSAAILTILLLKWINTRNSSTKQKPPGPPVWPVVGNMFDILGTTPHQNLYKLRFKYGPVLWLKLGAVNTMVIQSAKAAEEFFKKHDLPFSDRKIPDALTALSYYQGSLAFGNYGAYWRILRKLCSMELLVNKRLDDSTELRQKCIDKMVRWIEDDAAASRAQGRSGEVELPHFLFLMAFNLVGNLMLSRDLLGLQSKEGKEFYNAMSKIMEGIGKPNVADFLPFLKWMDPLRIKTNMVKDMGIAINIAASFVKDRIRENKSSSKKAKKDFLDMLLEYEGDGKEGPDKIEEKNINIIILVITLSIFFLLLGSSIMQSIVVRSVCCS